MDKGPKHNLRTLARAVPVRQTVELPFGAAAAMTGPPANAVARAPVLVDAHVHFHAIFDRDAFLDAASRNIRIHAARHRLDPAAPGVLMFTEASGDRYFEAWRARATARSGPGWTFRSTEEGCSLLALEDGQVRLVLVAGRQIVTAEKLEVLALGVAEEIPDGQPLDAAVSAVREADGVPVLPWGFGKWWFGRGRILDRWLGRAEHAGVFLGDNAGRPGFLPRPHRFESGAARRMFVLPGSDPLPFRAEEAKAGGYGFILETALSAGRPMAGIKEALAALETQPGLFGRLEGPLGFTRNQIAMQIKKRKRKR